MVFSFGIINLYTVVSKQFVWSMYFSSMHRAPVKRMTSPTLTFSMNDAPVLRKISTFRRFVFESKMVWVLILSDVETSTPPRKKIKFLNVLYPVRKSCSKSLFVQQRSEIWTSLQMVRILNGICNPKAQPFFFSYALAYSRGLGPLQ